MRWKKTYSTKFEIALGLYEPSGGALDSKTAHPSSMAERTLRRQTPKVGAVCLNWARTVLGGGRLPMRVPTAIPVRSLAENTRLIGREG